jgi:hypothetical protein
MQTISFRPNNDRTIGPFLGEREDLQEGHIEPDARYGHEGISELSEEVRDWERNSDTRPSLNDRGSKYKVKPVPVSEPGSTDESIEVAPKAEPKAKPRVKYMATLLDTPEVEPRTEPKEKPEAEPNRIFKCLNRICRPSGSQSARKKKSKKKKPKKTKKKKPKKTRKRRRSR